MKKFSYVLFATVFIVALSVVPSMANIPWDDSSAVVVEEGSNESTSVETATVVTSNESDSSDSNAKSAEAIVKGTISAGELNVRTSPWGDIMGTLKKDENVDIIGSVGDWYKINYHGKVGYIYGIWVTTPDHQGQTVPKYGVVSNCYWLNVRRTPSGDILTQYQAGTKVNIIGEAGDWYKIKYGNNEAYVSKKYIDLTTDGSSTTTKEENNGFESFTGYVNASVLNVRNGPWGKILGTLEKAEEVTITGKEGDWYTFDYEGQKGYVSASYIYNAKVWGDKAGSSSNYENASSAKDGSLQQNIVASAKSLVGSTNFRTKDVNYGSLACAKVATTALKNAGSLDKVYLNCRDTVKALKAKGWVEVTPPPYQEGDVITWKTYDYTGDGIKDEDTHIGIIVKEGNTYKAMNNSSKLKTPRVTNINIAPISRVLRKV